MATKLRVKKPHDIEDDEFVDYVKRHLLRLLPGATASRELQPSRSRKSVAVLNNNRVAVRLEGWQKALVLERVQYFEQPDRDLISAFVEELELVRRLSSDVRELLTERIEERTIIRIIASASGAGKENMLGVAGRVVALARAWSERTYEGRRIAAGFRMGDVWSPGALGRRADIYISDIERSEYFCALSDGISVLFAVGLDHSLISIDPVAQRFDAKRVAEVPWAYRYQTVAAKKDPTVLLNRHGEILVFISGILRFAMRSGRWIHYSSKSIKKSMGGFGVRLKRAIYESALDVSFGRTGGCIGVLSSTIGERALYRDIVGKDQVVGISAEEKCMVIGDLLAGRKFQDVERAIRLRLLAMDGALVLRPSGAVVAAGAILKIDAGSPSGGRRAAAAKLGRHGLGLKISADGGMQGFRGLDEDGNALQVISS